MPWSGIATFVLKALYGCPEADATACLLTTRNGNRWLQNETRRSCLKSPVRQIWAHLHSPLAANQAPNQRRCSPRPTHLCENRAPPLRRTRCQHTSIHYCITVPKPKALFSMEKRKGPLVLRCRPHLPLTLSRCRLPQSLPVALQWNPQHTIAPARQMRSENAVAYGGSANGIPTSPATVSSLTLVPDSSVQYGRGSVYSSPNFIYRFSGLARGGDGKTAGDCYWDLKPAARTPI